MDPAPSSPYLGQGNRSPNPRREIALRCLWAAVQHTLFRWSPRGLHAFRVALLRLFGAAIPADGQVRIYPTASIIYPWKLSCAKPGDLPSRCWRRSMWLAIGRVARLSLTDQFGRLPDGLMRMPDL